MTHNSQTNTTTLVKTKCDTLKHYNTVGKALYSKHFNTHKEINTKQHS